jgi:homoserine dehydrogenase
MHVITAKKGPIAWAFEELCAIAKSRGVKFLYETTVMDGAPIFNFARHCLSGCEILSFEGILNTTTNFILSEMERGGTFDDAVAEAQRRGFAEADPTMDITGMDAAAKTCALANALMRGKLTPPEISAHGIQDVTPEDVTEAQNAGQVIKLLCRGFKEGGRVRGVVEPVRLSLAHPFASITGTSSVLTVETDLMGKITVIEHDPEIEQTAYGIYSDMLQLL